MNEAQNALRSRLETELHTVMQEIEAHNRAIAEATRARDIAARSMDALRSAISRMSPAPTVVARTA